MIPYFVFNIKSHTSRDRGQSLLYPITAPYQKIIMIIKYDSACPRRGVPNDEEEQAKEIGKD
jgi:hypothetical protein